ncbi:hypothetical protein KKC94_03715 [Patescibacteria group bacterium]|nr:hypothetical protein [Patescibacteria group bacterium]
MMSCCGNHGRETGLWLGLILFVIGAVILLQLFDVIPETTWDYLWPSILVVAGLKLMVTSAEACGYKEYKEGSCGSDMCCKSGSCMPDECCDSGVCEPCEEKPKKKATKKKTSKKK